MDEKIFLLLGTALAGGIAYLWFTRPSSSVDHLPVNTPVTPAPSMTTNGIKSLSGNGASFIAAREGWRPKVYADVAGYMTIGYGHKIVAGDGISAATVLTPAQGLALLYRDVKPVETIINNIVRVPITQNMFDALASLGFNIGPSALAASTLIKRLNSGDVQGAANAFNDWIYAGGKLVVGLQNRRDLERHLFLS